MRIDGLTGIAGIIAIAVIVFVAYQMGKRGTLG